MCFLSNWSAASQYGQRFTLPFQGVGGMESRWAQLGWEILQRLVCLLSDIGPSDLFFLSDENMQLAFLNPQIQIYKSNIFCLWQVVKPLKRNYRRQVKLQPVRQMESCNPVNMNTKAWLKMNVHTCFGRNCWIRTRGRPRATSLMRH